MEMNFLLRILFTTSPTFYPFRFTTFRLFFVLLPNVPLPPLRLRNINPISPSCFRFLYSFRASYSRSFLFCLPCPYSPCSVLLFSSALLSLYILNTNSYRIYSIKRRRGSKINKTINSAARKKNLGTTWKFTPSRHLRFCLSKIRERLEPLNYIIFTNDAITVVGDFEINGALE